MLNSFQGFQGLGVSGLGFRGLGILVSLGFRVLGAQGCGFWGVRVFRGFSGVRVWGFREFKGVCLGVGVKVWDSRSLKASVNVECANRNSGLSPRHGCSAKAFCP